MKSIKIVLVLSLLLGCAYVSNEPGAFPISVPFPKDYSSIFNSEISTQLNHIYSGVPIDSMRYAYSKLSLGDSLFFIMTKYEANNNLNESFEFEVDEVKPNGNSWYDDISFTPIWCYALNDTISTKRFTKLKLSSSTKSSYQEIRDEYFIISGRLNDLSIQINDDDKVLAYYKKRDYSQNPSYYATILNLDEYSYFVLVIGVEGHTISIENIKNILNYPAGSSMIE